MKKCTKCKEQKDVVYFAKDSRVKSGLKSYCKECNKKLYDSKRSWKGQSVKRKEYKREYYKIKRRLDADFRMKETMRKYIKQSFKTNGYTKSSRTYEIIGCSFEELKLHLESKFEYWMTWDNKGLYNGELNYGWDIDHIIPLSSATTEEEVIRLNHYTNLQPLCGYVNRHIKRNN